jgi:FKBP-type peptidyl-prolyl cis-trans isomerase SlyD
LLALCFASSSFSHYQLEGNSMQIANETVVAFDYILTDDQGEVLDSSEGREPLAYLHGSGGIIPGLEAALEGKKVGDQLDVSIAPEDAYGVRNETLVRNVPRAQFNGVDSLEVGMQFRANTDAGQMVFTVVSIAGDSIEIDGNHPLAGMRLNFNVTIREVRDASQEEIQHGHVHGPGGHHHH